MVLVAQVPFLVLFMEFLVYFLPVFMLREYIAGDTFLLIAIPVSLYVISANFNPFYSVNASVLLAVSICGLITYCYVFISFKINGKSFWKESA